MADSHHLQKIEKSSYFSSVTVWLIDTLAKQSMMTL